MSAKYNEDFKKEVVDAYIKSAKSYAEIAAEFNISKTSVRDWTKKYSEEYQYTTNNKNNNNNNKSNIDYVNEIKALNRQLKEKEKEIDFLKKAAAFFAKELD
jgi:transposase